MKISRERETFLFQCNDFVMSANNVDKDFQMNEEEQRRIIHVNDRENRFNGSSSTMSTNQMGTKPRKYHREDQLNCEIETSRRDLELRRIFSSTFSFLSMHSFRNRSLIRHSPTRSTRRRLEGRMCFFLSMSCRWRSSSLLVHISPRVNQCG